MGAVLACGLSQRIRCMFPCDHTLLHTVALNYIDFKLVASGNCLAIGAVLANVGFHMPHECIVALPMHHVF